MTALLFVFPAASFARQATPEEKYFLDAANRERIAHRLPSLKWDDALADAARRHATLMVQHGELSHQFPGELPLDQRAVQAGARFSRVGENVAFGPRIESIHTGWMHSPGHRANILDVHFTAVGVGVVGSNDQLFAVEDFSTAVADLHIEAQEEKVSALLAAQGLRVSRDRQQARKLCSSPSATTGALGPCFQLRIAGHQRTSGGATA